VSHGPEAPTEQRACGKGPSGEAPRHRPARGVSRLELAALAGVAEHQPASEVLYQLELRRREGRSGFAGHSARYAKYSFAARGPYSSQMSRSASPAVTRHGMIALDGPTKR
jgi:hypothetical protein